MTAPLPDIEVIDWCAKSYGLSQKFVMATWETSWHWACAHVQWPYPSDNFPHGVHAGAIMRMRATLEANPRTRAALNYCAHEILAPFRYQ